MEAGLPRVKEDEVDTLKDQMKGLRQREDGVLGVEPGPAETGSTLAREGHAQTQGDQHAARQPPDYPGEPQATL
jgi:hypothetical protein